MPIEINNDFRRALELMETSSTNIFITGKAGTGKSTLLEYFRHHTKKNVVVLAPTGVAAVNVNGQTIHSFFGFRPTITLEQVKKLSPRRQKLFRKVDSIVVDEISMVRADLLDCMDKFLRLNGRLPGRPFGGVQMVFIGDLYQLPPVIRRDEESILQTRYQSAYFFDATAFQASQFEYIELEKIYRQKDPIFIDLLNGIRNNKVTDEHLSLLNKRVDPGFESPPGDFYVHLTTVNALAEELNRAKLDQLHQPVSTFQGELAGEFDPKYLPAPETLAVKPGSQVMLLNNDSAGRWINGTMGKVERIDNASHGDGSIQVRLGDGDKVKVLPYTWQISKYLYDERADRIGSEVIGSFTQYPLRLAWAITIHKSQGKTFDKVIVDLRRPAFAPGQIYVALSRCRTLEGIVLLKLIEKKHVFVDWRIVKFLTRFQYDKSHQALPLEEKVRLIQETIRNRKDLQMTYLKGTNEKSRRVVTPGFVGEMEYEGKKYLGLRGFDSLRKQDRTFRVDRILELKPLA